MGPVVLWLAVVFGALLIEVRGPRVAPRFVASLALWRLERLERVVRLPEAMRAEARIERQSTDYRSAARGRIDIRRLPWPCELSTDDLVGRWEAGGFGWIRARPGTQPLRGGLVRIDALAEGDDIRLAVRRGPWDWLTVATLFAMAAASGRGWTLLLPVAVAVAAMAWRWRRPAADDARIAAVLDRLEHALTADARGEG